jgi:hypothetical protein
MRGIEMGVLYITHCTNKKNPCLKDTGEKVPPDKLYIGDKITGFINRCNNQNVEWAIFSDLYGIWFPHERHKYYDKHPNEVSDEEFNKLLDDSEKKLKKYGRVYFYGNHRSPRFHHLYKKLITQLRKRGLKIIKICSIYDI